MAARETATPQTAETTAPVDQQVFRDVIGRFASGVTVVSTREGDRDLGTTASAVSSLSMDPPMLLICMNRTSDTGKAISGSGRFVVNILGEDQASLAKHFATKSPDKFADVEVQRGPSGLPRLARALGHLECRVAETATGGTHTVFLSHVEHASATEGSPLTYFRGRFGRFEDAAQEAAYQQLRRLVMSRTLGPGETLSVEDLAAELEVERHRVQYALTKLMGDGLVERDPDRGFIVRPLDARMARDAIEARCMIEMAVADHLAGMVDEATLADLRRHAQLACDAVSQDPPDYRLLRSSGRKFHATFIALAGNQTLIDVYRRLRIDAIWGRLLRGRHLSPAYLVDVVDGLAAGDAAAAKRALRDHADHAIDVVDEMIADAGGSI